MREGYEAVSSIPKASYGCAKEWVREEPRYRGPEWLPSPEPVSHVLTFRMGLPTPPP